MIGDLAIAFQASRGRQSRNNASTGAKPFAFFEDTVFPRGSRSRIPVSCSLVSSDRTVYRMTFAILCINSVNGKSHSSYNTDFELSFL